MMDASQRRVQPFVVAGQAAEAGGPGEIALDVGEGNHLQTQAVRGRLLGGVAPV